MYGTLKRGFYNHRLLREMDAKFLGEALTREPMRMVLGEYGIPYLMRGESDGSAVVPGELWEVDDEGLDALDVLEGIDEGMYERVTLDVATREGADGAVMVASRRQRRRSCADRSPSGAASERRGARRSRRTT